MTNNLKMRPWKISFAASKQNAISSSNSSLSTSRTKSDLDKLDLSIAQGDFICIEYIEEKPPILMNFAMASAIFNFRRIPDRRDNDEKKQRLKLDAIANDDSNTGVRIPRHIRLLSQQRDIKQKFDLDGPELEYGETKILSVNDKSPFLGDILVGETQSAIINKLYKDFISNPYI